jgi:hypothetical protein
MCGLNLIGLGQLGLAGLSLCSLMFLIHNHSLAPPTGLCALILQKVQTIEVKVIFASEFKLTMRLNVKCLGKCIAV